MTARNDEPFTFDPAQLAELSARYGDAYRSASPFAHVVIDDFVPEDVVALAASEFPPADAADWSLHVHSNSNKRALADPTAMRQTCRQLVAEFNSGAVTTFMERLTGIDGLIPDPHLFGGGLHECDAGGFLQVHADFNRHPKLQLDRRVNALLFLNPEWHDEWGGALELWNRDMSTRERVIAPVGGRLVVFSTTSVSYHGHPRPLRSPDDVSRRSLALYYYTAGRPESEREAVHSTLYQQPGVAPKSVGMQAKDSWVHR